LGIADRNTLTMPAMPETLPCLTTRPMTWGEFKQAVETCGMADGIAIAATDAYSPQSGKRLAASVTDGATLMQTVLCSSHT